MNLENNLQKLKETKQKVIEVVTELDRELHQHEIDQLKYHDLLENKLNGGTKKEILKYLDHEIEKVSTKIRENYEKERENLENEEQETKFHKKRMAVATLTFILIICITLIVLNETEIFLL